MGIDKLLIINDDSADILAIQARLPNISVQAASQWEAQNLEQYVADVILLDNDANDLKQSKGAQTLLKIREKAPDVPMLYSSFQPSWVPQEVYKDKNVQVVRTDQLLEELALRHNVEVLPAKQSGKPEPQANLIISYNPVNNYPEGVYANGKLIVVSYPKHAKEEAQRVVQEHMSNIWQDIDWRADRDKIRNAFVYDGQNGGEWPGRLAQAMGHDARMVVNLLACRCDWERKQRFANSTYVNLFEVGCGGGTELGMVADIILGIGRPGVNSDRLPMTSEQVLAPAQQFQL
tara:strand:- start:186 stop:1055 length:870 start_codon:yes stop_codon:yes gene_type:complete